MRQTVGDLSGATFCLFLHKRVDQLDGREDPDAIVIMLDSVDADCRGTVRLSPIELGRLQKM